MYKKRKIQIDDSENENVRNLHLINAHDLIGVNTVHTCENKYVCDITDFSKIPCPKISASPWLQSSSGSSEILDANMKFPDPIPTTLNQVTQDPMVSDPVTSDPMVSNQEIPDPETEKWFDMNMPSKIENSHLFNVYRPIGVNTIGSSFKTTSHDIRGLDEKMRPKFTVSPWLQESFEPDLLCKSLCI